MSPVIEPYHYDHNGNGYDALRTAENEKSKPQVNFYAFSVVFRGFRWSLLSRESKALFEQINCRYQDDYGNDKA